MKKNWFKKLFGKKKPAVAPVYEGTVEPDEDGMVTLITKCNRCGNEGMVRYNPDYFFGRVPPNTCMCGEPEPGE